MADWFRLTVLCIRCKQGSHISSLVVVGFLGGAIGGGAIGNNGGEYSVGTVGACGIISGNPVGGAKAVVVPLVVGVGDCPGFSKTGGGEFSKTGGGISGKGL